MDVIDIFERMRGKDGHWSAWERSELTRLKNAFGQEVYDQVWQEGVTDCGEPWMVAVDDDGCDLVLHVTRLGDNYVALDGDLSTLSSGPNLKSVVSACVTHIDQISRNESSMADRSVLRMPAGVSATALAVLVVEHLRESDLWHIADLAGTAPTALRLEGLDVEGLRAALTEAAASDAETPATDTEGDDALFPTATAREAAATSLRETQTSPAAPTPQRGMALAEISAAFGAAAIQEAQAPLPATSAEVAPTATIGPGFKTDNIGATEMIAGPASAEVTPSQAAPTGTTDLLVQGSAATDPDMSADGDTDPSSETGSDHGAASEQTYVDAAYLVSSLNAVMLSGLASAGADMVLTWGDIKILDEAGAADDPDAAAQDDPASDAPNAENSPETAQDAPPSTQAAATKTDAAALLHAIAAQAAADGFAWTFVDVPPGADALDQDPTALAACDSDTDPAALDISLDDFAIALHEGEICFI